MTAPPHASPSLRAAPIQTRGAKARLRQEIAGNPDLDTYLKSIAHFPLLDRTEEKDLGHTLIAGRVEIGPLTPAAWRARNTLIESNLRLVVSIAVCYTDQGMPIMDIIGAGNIGLIRAVDKYIPGRARLGTHATWWIREACSRYVMAKTALIHLPRNIIASRQRIHKIEREALTDGVILDVDEMAARAAMTPKQVKRARATQEQVLSLDAAIETSHTGRDGETVTLVDTLADEQAATAETHATRSCVRDELHRKLAIVLTGREREVLRHRYGLGDLGGVTLTLLETGEALHMNRETVRKLEMGALAKLRASYEADGNPSALRQAIMFQAG